MRKFLFLIVLSLMVSSAWAQDPVVVSGAGTSAINDTYTFTLSFPGTITVYDAPGGGRAPLDSHHQAGADARAAR